MTALRVAAFGIAILAVLDPSLTASRSSRPIVSIVAADRLKDALLVDRVERMLSRRFTVVQGSFPSAAGTVLVGESLPNSNVSADPLMVVEPTPGKPSLRIAGLDAPATSPVNSRIEMRVGLYVEGAEGRNLDVELKSGDVLVYHRLEPVVADSVDIRFATVYVPTTAGVTPLVLKVRIEGTAIADSATTVVEASESRLAVLFYDPRASWASTFVRRAVEQDPRFAVTHRVVTSRGVSNAAGAAPVSLRDAQSFGKVGAIVVGAPEALSDADVRGLETFMRERGGRVVVLMERRAAGPIDRLTGAHDWRAVRLASATELESWSPTSLTLKTQEIAWPATLPIGATTLASAVARDSTRRPIVWSVPVGAGRLLVSGALDAWHYRGDETRGFDAWTNVIAQLAASAPHAIDVSVTNRSIAPGQTTSVNVWIRDAVLSRRGNPSATVSAVFAGPNDTTIVRLWPDHSPGSFSGTIVAPRTAGTYRIVARSDTERSEASLVVDPEARAPTRDERHLMSAFAASRKGRVISEADLGDLPGALSSALESVSRVETWHPMRSAWWIVPFAILLGAEWWWRRRRGLA